MESFHVIHIKGRISGNQASEMWISWWKCALDLTNIFFNDIITYLEVIGT